MTWNVAIQLNEPKEYKMGKQANVYTDRQVTFLQGTKFS